MLSKIKTSSLYLLLFAVLFSAKSAFAEAEELAAFTGIFCNFYGMIKGPIGKTIAILGVCMIGMMLLLGKASWGQMAIVFLFVALVFAAPQIVDILTGEGELCAG